MPKEEIAIDLLEEALERGEEVALSTSTDSMIPLLQPGKMFRVKKVPSHEIRVGDIVCFEADQRVIVHRVVKKFRKEGERFLITKGDHLFQLDLPTLETKILGRVVQIGDLRLDRPFQSTVARLVAQFFYWHCEAYRVFWQIPGIQFLARLKQRWISKRSIFTPLYMGFLRPVYRYLSSCNHGDRFSREQGGK